MKTFTVETEELKYTYEEQSIYDLLVNYADIIYNDKKK